MRRLFLLIILLNVLLLSSCNQLSVGKPFEPTVTPFLYKAVYLTNGPGELAIADLKAHPEVIVTLTFNDFKSHAGSKIAL